MKSITNSLYKTVYLGRGEILLTYSKRLKSIILSNQIDVTKNKLVKFKVGQTLKTKSDNYKSTNTLMINLASEGSANAINTLLHQLEELYLSGNIITDKVVDDDSKVVYDISNLAKFKDDNEKLVVLIDKLREAVK